MGIILACLLGQTYSSLTYNSTLSQTSTKPSLQLPVLGWSGPGWHASSGCLHSSCSPQLCRGSGRSADHFLLRLSQAMVHRQSLPGKMKSSDRITAAPSDVLPKCCSRDSRDNLIRSHVGWTKDTWPPRCSRIRETRPWQKKVMWICWTAMLGRNSCLLIWNHTPDGKHYQPVHLLGEGPWPMRGKAHLTLVLQTLPSRPS